MLDRRLCQSLLLGIGLGLADTAWAQEESPAGAARSEGNSADLSVFIFDSPDPIGPGMNLTHSIGVENLGPGTAAGVTLATGLSPFLTFVSLSATSGWTCTTPPVGASGAIQCSIASFGLEDFGSFTLVSRVEFGASAAFTVATVSSSTPDPISINNSASTDTLVAPSTDASITKTAAAGTVLAGSQLSYAIVARREFAPSSFADVEDQLPAGTTFVSFTAPPGWTCTTPAVGAGGRVRCTTMPFSVIRADFALVLQVDAASPAGSSLANTATIVAANIDPDLDDRVSTATVQVLAPASLAATKIALGPAVPGGPIAYRIVLTNAGPFTQGDYAGDEFADLLPPELILTGATASSGTVLTSAGTNTATWNGAIPAGESVTIDIEATVDPATAAGTTIANQGTLRWDADGDGASEATAATDDPAAGGNADPTLVVVTGGGPPSVEVPALGSGGLLALAALISAAAFLKLRR